MSWLTPRISPRISHTAVLAGVGLMFAVALYMEHAMGLEPCALCMMQRIWLGVVGAVAFIALVHGPKRWGRHVYAGLGAGAALTGAGFSIRQIYLQSLPPDQVPACGPSLEYMLEVFPMQDVIELMITGSGDCAVVQWSFAGLSIPAWTLVAFVGLGGVFVLSSIVAARRSPGKRR